MLFSHCTGLKTTLALENKLSGGYDDTNSCTTFVAAIIRPENSYCSAVIISSYFLLTSAACIYSYMKQFNYGGLFAKSEKGEHEIMYLDVNSKYVLHPHDSIFNIGVVIVSHLPILFYCGVTIK